MVFKSALTFVRHGAAELGTQHVDYRNLGLRLTYDPETRTMRADIDLAAHRWEMRRLNEMAVACPSKIDPGRNPHSHASMPAACARTNSVQLRPLRRGAGPSRRRRRMRRTEVADTTV